MKVKPKKCRGIECENTFTPRRSFDKFCSYDCFVKAESKKETKVKGKRKRIKRTRINPVSEKRKIQNRRYVINRSKFLEKPENQICFVDGCKAKANTIEHQKGRQGYADDYAREKEIILLLDERFWKPCCLHHNLEFERNAELSKKYQLSKIHDGKKI